TRVVGGNPHCASRSSRSSVVEGDAGKRNAIDGGGKRPALTNYDGCIVSIGHADQARSKEGSADKSSGKAIAKVHFSISPEPTCGSMHMGCACERSRSWHSRLSVRRSRTPGPLCHL